MNFYIAGGTDYRVAKNVYATAQRLRTFSPKTKNAMEQLQNVIVLKDSQSDFPEGFSNTKAKLAKYGEDAYGFVCKPDSAIVINEQNHKRKDCSLEGNIADQASDTLSHEVGHLIDKEYSTSESFKQAYLQDLTDISKKLDEAEGDELSDLKATIYYFKHYMEGVDFSDGIDEKDITREGLRENFAECFSTIVDDKPSKVNSIYTYLFPHTMKQTLDFVV